MDTDYCLKIGYRDHLISVYTDRETGGLENRHTQTNTYLSWILLA
jgi:hypothetical protein